MGNPLKSLAAAMRGATFETNAASGNSAHAGAAAKDATFAKQAAGAVGEGVTTSPALQTYKELTTKAQEILAQAEQIRQGERKVVIDQIKATMKEYGLSVQEIFGGQARKGKSDKGVSKPKATKGVVKYRKSESLTWGGGAGRRPAWVNQAIENGEDIEKYRVA